MALKDNFLRSRQGWIIQGLGNSLVLIGMDFLDWPPLRYWGVRGIGSHFQDLRSILREGDCYRIIGENVYHNNGGCTGYIYGQFLLNALSFFHIHENLTDILGYVFLFLIGGSVAYLFRDLTFEFSWLFKAAIIFSPPVLLLAERANFDVLIFVLVVISAKLVSQERTLVACLCLLLAALMKFYALPVLFTTIIFTHKQRTRMVLFGASIVTCYLVLLDLKKIETKFPQLWSAQFGMSIWGRYFNVLNLNQLNENFVSGSGFLIFLVSIVIFLKIGITPKKFINVTRLNPQSHYANFYLLFGTHLACFIAGMNFDYRLIFMVGATSGLLCTGLVRSSAQKQGILIALLLVLWLSYNAVKIQPIGDIILEFMTAWYLLIFAALFRFDRRSA
jgi:hypothetical protein